MSQPAACACGQVLFDIGDRKPGDTLTCPGAERKYSYVGGGKVEPLDAAEKKSAEKKSSEGRTNDNLPPDQKDADKKHEHHGDHHKPHAVHEKKHEREKERQKKHDPH